MVGNIHSVRFISSLLIFLELFTSSGVQAEQGVVPHPHLIEVFTTVDVPVTGEVTINRQPELQASELQIYKLDVIQRFEADLSRSLLADPVQSKQMALQLIQWLDEASRAKIHHVAIGLVKTAQYGIDRYPAIVLDGEVLIYGVVDVPEAIHRYVLWREDR